MKIRPRAIALSTLALAATTGLGGAQEAHDHSAAKHQLGRVTFPNSCNARAKPTVEQGVAMLHSFWFEQAQRTFEQAATDDPACAMAYWGVAMTLLGNPFTGQEPPEPRLEAALAAAERATALGASATPRERDYIAAALALYRDPQTVDFRTRMRAHETLLRAAYERNPGDDEASIFYARAVIANAPPNDLTFARQKYAASILEPLFARFPQHPGLAHYLIHAHDAPAMASRGLDAARRYASIAPDAPHALHMPSHIFTRLGYWDESIETNRRSQAAEPNPSAAVHPMDYMVYAFLQQGRDEDARAVVTQAVELPDRFYGGVVGYNFTAMPARYTLERGRWAEAADLTAPTGALPFVEAVTRFARAIGAARSGRLPQARTEVAALQALRDTLQMRKDSYWATIVGAQRLAAAAWVARGEGKSDSAVRLAREAAELEETVEKHPVTPGPLLPARELLGDLLLELDRPADALAAYEKALEREPNRARSLYGAARAAERARSDAVARKRYTELLELMRRADATREEPRLARAFLAAR